MASLLDDVEEVGDLSLSATDFDDGEQMPDYVGYVNAEALASTQLIGEYAPEQGTAF